MFPKVDAEALEIGDSGKETNLDYLTDDLTVQALQFIEERSKIKDKPFFLYFSHFAIHAPYQGKDEEIAHFESKETKKPRLVKVAVFNVVPPGIEPGTHGFSVHCSTN